ncbi:VanZ family protein [Rothia dentocariosa]|uniref:VanZ family protein n=1 Tax=Rothia dentocariosa TaxID=2047 RepID=UPI002042570F|nr:VanZ family protein [Rothia dentocariosa]MCM3438994.1 VanZ family protein [Rothia dentocariosa]
MSGRSGRVLRALGWALFALYCAAVAAIVFAPQHVDDNEAGSRLASLLDTGHAQGWLPGFITYASIEQLSNVIMFAPGGFLLMLLLFCRTRPWRRVGVITLGAVAVSAGIELIQTAMPERTGDPIDVLMNGTGAFIGSLTAWGVHGLWMRWGKR